MKRSASRSPAAQGSPAAQVGRAEGAQLAATPAVEVVDLTVAFATRNEARFLAVDQCSFAVEQGEFFSIVGPSGCGKSTLLFALDGLLPYAAGEVRISGAKVDAPGWDRAMVFQDYGLLPWRTSLANVMLPLEVAANPRRLQASERKEVARHFLAKVGLDGFADHYPGQLSGGMRQRVGIARALATGAQILLMDEPFASVDAQTKDLMGAELLRICQQENKTVIFITHDLDEAVYLSDRVAVMSSRPARVKEIFDTPLGRPRPLEIRGSHEFAELRRQVWTSLRAEISTLSWQLSTEEQP